MMRVNLLLWYDHGPWQCLRRRATAVREICSKENMCAAGSGHWCPSGSKDRPSSRSRAHPHARHRADPPPSHPPPPPARCCKGTTNTVLCLTRSNTSKAGPVIWTLQYQDSKLQQLGAENAEATAGYSKLNETGKLHGAQVCNRALCGRDQPRSLGSEAEAHRSLQRSITKVERGPRACVRCGNEW